MEIGAAVAAGKRVYVLHGFPLIGADELQAYGARLLGGRLDALVKEYEDAIGGRPEQVLLDE